jgi:hypothetical protein
MAHYMGKGNGRPEMEPGPAPRELRTGRSKRRPYAKIHYRSRLRASLAAMEGLTADAPQ